MLSSWFEIDVKTTNRVFRYKNSDGAQTTWKTKIINESSEPTTLKTTDEFYIQYFDFKTTDELNEEQIKYNLRCGSLYFSQTGFEITNIFKPMLDFKTYSPKITNYLYNGTSDKKNDLRQDKTYEIKNDDGTSEFITYSYENRVDTIIRLYVDQIYKTNDNNNILLCTNPITNYNIKVDERINKTIIFKQFDEDENDVNSMIMAHHTGTIGLSFLGRRKNIWPRLVALLEYVITFILLCEHSELMKYINNNKDNKDFLIQIHIKKYIKDYFTNLSDYAYLDTSNNILYLNYDYINYFVTNIYNVISKSGFVEPDKHNVYFINNNSFMNFDQAKQIFSKSDVLIKYTLEQLSWAISFTHNTCRNKILNDLYLENNVGVLEQEGDITIMQKLYKVYKKYKSLTICQFSEFASDLYEEKYDKTCKFNQLFPAIPKIKISDGQISSNIIFDKISITQIDEGIKLREIFVDDSNLNNYTINSVYNNF